MGLNGQVVLGNRIRRSEQPLTAAGMNAEGNRQSYGN
jgi:hypothetical protein